VLPLSSVLLLQLHRHALLLLLLLHRLWPLWLLRHAGRLRVRCRHDSLLRPLRCTRLLLALARLVRAATTLLLLVIAARLLCILAVI
jgi:hypothetical protein